MSQNFSGVLSILSKSTSKHLAMTCLSHKLDYYINFIIHEIALGISEKSPSPYNLYFKWIDSRVFSSIGDTSIIKPNIVRYLIINNLHNETYDAKIEESSIITAKSLIIEWLLNISQHNQLEHSNIKLALLYEIIVFQENSSLPNRISNELSNFMRILINCFFFLKYFETFLT